MIIYIAFGALLIVLTTPLVLGLVPPNPWYGIRLPSHATPSKWYALNRRGGLVFFLLGTGFVLVGAGSYWLAPGMETGTRAFLAILIIPVFIMAVILAMIVASRLDG